MLREHSPAPLKQMICCALLGLLAWLPWATAKEKTPDIPPPPPPPNEALKGDPLAWAEENLNSGRYKEACEILKKAVKENADSPKLAEMTCLFAESQRMVGKYSDALTLMEALSAKDPKDERAASLKGQLMLDVGRYTDAYAVFDGLVKARSDNHRAWALRKKAAYMLGKKEIIKETADHFFDLFQKNSDYYYSDNVKDPMELAYVGLGIQDENPKDAFEVGFLLAEGLIKKRSLRMPEAFLWSAELALEKYSFDNAMQRYTEILKMRPNSPDGLAGMADVWISARHDLNRAEPMLKKSLEINPNHIHTLLLQAGVALEEDRYEDAKKAIDTALAVNPNHLEGLATLTFYYHELGQADKEAEVEKKINSIHAKPSEYYFLVGEMLEHKRKFPDAPPYYKKAMEIDPTDWRGYYGLGMNISRQGAHGEVEGKKLVLKAFEMNRFNVWASNMVSVLDKLIGDKDQDVKPHYQESKTKHFTLKFHDKEAEIVRPYLEEWCESAYAWQTKKFGFEPEGPLTFELMYSSDDNGARTVGLPILGILGVCFGKMCTVVSPREGKEKLPPFNWRRTIEHEFGHVMTLQATKFKIPRWYTEAFSTYIEDDSRVDSDLMMVQALAKNEVKSLGKLNEYFRNNMLMAYVHGRYVIEYIDKTFGFEAHIKALKLFGEGKTLEEALVAATGKTLEELDKGQMDYTREFFKKVHLRPRYDVADLARLELAANATEATAQDLANLAIYHYSTRQGGKAAELSKKALEKDPKCSDALNLLARQAFDKKDYTLAKKLFEDAIAAAPDRSYTAWQKLGVLYKKEGKTSKAIEALEKARAIYPRYQGEDNPHYLLPELYTDLEKPDNEKALQVWRDAVKVNSADALAAKNGLKMAIEVKDWKAATEFATSFIEIDPYDLEVHQKAGRAYMELKDLPHAIREFHIATVIDNLDIESWVGLAKAQVSAGNKDEAKKAVEKALEVDGTHAEAKEMRKKLAE